MDSTELMEAESSSTEDDSSEESSSSNEEEEGEQPQQQVRNHNRCALIRNHVPCSLKVMKLSSLPLPVKVKVCRLLLWLQLVVFVFQPLAVMIHK